MSRAKRFLLDHQRDLAPPESLIPRPERQCVAPQVGSAPDRLWAQERPPKQSALQSKPRKCCGNAHMRDENDVENRQCQLEASVPYPVQRE